MQTYTFSQVWDIATAFWLLGWIMGCVFMFWVINKRIK